MTNEVIVVKLGGTDGVDFSAICHDAAQQLKQGKQLVFVHGGSAEANFLGEALGAPPKMITSPSGYTAPDGAVTDVGCQRLWVVGSGWPASASHA